MPLVTSFSHAPARNLGLTSGESLGAMALVKPTSIVSTGTGSSAIINPNGSVTFNSCATISLNGVFTSTYDNYIISGRTSSSGGAGSPDIFMRLRVSGTDNSTASSYVYQELNAGSTSITAARVTSDIGRFGANYNSDAQRNGFILYVYGPALAQPTAARSNTVSSTSGAYLSDIAVTHNQSTSYDGMTISLQSGFTMSGLISVYGLVGA